MPRAQSKSVEPPTVPADERERQDVEKRFLEIRHSHGDVTEKRLRDLYFIWKNPINAEGKIQRLRGDEITELQSFEIPGVKMKLKFAASVLPLQCSRSQFIAHVNKVYGKPNNKEWFLSQIAQWAANGFPINKGKSNLNSKPCLDWFLQNVFDPALAGGAATGEETEIARITRAERKRKEADAERSERANLEEKRKCDARWMLTEAFQFYGEGWFTIERQFILSLLKNVLDDAKLSGKEIALDEATVERLAAAMRPKLDARFVEWQNNLVGDPKVPVSIGKLGELEKAAKELSDQKKAELKIKI